MKKANNLTLLDWGNIYQSCRECRNDFLMEAINFARSRNNRAVIEPAAAEHLSVDSIAKIAVQLILETNIYDELNAEVWIDPEGHYKIPLSVHTSP